MLLGFSQGKVHAQTEQIQGVINKYASIKTIISSTSQDSLVLKNLIPGDWGSGDGDWSAGDTVMVYCVSGGSILLADGTMGNPRFSGKYAFLIINEILFGADTAVVLNNNMGAEIDPLTTGEVAQLIRVRSFHSAEVVGEVTAQPWDGATGGVVAMFVSTTLKLGADIDVTGLGFRGADEQVLYEGECSTVDTALYDDLHYEMDNVLAGIKGEGVTHTLFDRLRGKGRNINGGGGGNGKLSGGGGGSNASSGGSGGRESGDCGPGVSDPGGVGGMSLDPVGGLYYLNYDEIIFPTLNLWNRIFFGGGGGSGVNVPLRDAAAPGGNGGGLVVIVADTIDGSGWIRADGASVTDIVDGAGSGGGGGGAIILDVSGYKNNPRLSTVGGDGGSTNHPTDTTGPGGGGGGGIYWLAGNPETSVSPVTEVHSQGGQWLSSIGFGATDGSKPQRKDGLEVPLRGFLFNAVPSEFRVCSDQVPDSIRASEPKGGSGSYTFQWVDSSATQNQWQDVSGATKQSLSFSDPLADTTYFRRIVMESPQVLPADTSSRIAVYVHHAITNNTISAPDTVCQGNIPEAFVSVGLPGTGLGPGSYTYLWQKNEGGGYTAADGSNTGTGYQPPTGLDVTTDFVRITKSGVCTDTSTALAVTVLMPITGNFIADKDTICYNTRPELIIQKSGEVIGGGNFPPDMRYQWESSPAETGPWTKEGGAAATTSSYRPAELTATTWYRRMALSGNGNACIDSSNAVEILNVPLITGNQILTADQTVCTGDQPGNMLGSLPGGGLDGYYYLWESSTSSGWVPADATNGNNEQSYTPPVMNGDTTVYRRTVSSGGEYPGVCKDGNATKVINVLPSIVNNEIMTDVTVNCQFDQLSDLIQNPAGGSEPGGGATENGVDPTRNYRWEQSTGDTPGTWTEISYGSDKMNYTDSPDLSLTEDYWFRRIVLSGPTPGLEGKAQVCSSPSNAVHIQIHTAISNNIIDAFDSVCFNTEKILHGETPSGEEDLSPSYSWRDAVSGAELGTEELLPYTISSLETRQFNRIVVIGECEDTSAMMDITVMELPGGVLSGDLLKACEKDVDLDVDLNIEGLTNYLVPWEISLSDGVNTQLTDPQQLEADGTVMVSLSTDEISTQYEYTIGELIYTLVDGTVCAAPVGNLSGSVPLEVFLTPDPKITVTTVLTDDAVCDNEVALTVDPDNGTGIWESNYPAYLGFLNDPQDLSVRASIDSGDSLAWLNLPYSIFFKSEAGDCAGTDTVKISFFEQPDAANAGADDTIYLRNSTWLNANPATAGEGTWTTSGSGEFEDEHDPKTFVFNMDKGERNEFTWTIVNGVCVDKDDRSVIAQDKAQPYEGFSPNEDMVNDYFIIRGLADATEFSITIFNALGRMVREITHENIEDIEYDPAMIPGGLRDGEAVIWDGTAKDNETPVPAGTYYYVISIMIEQVDDMGNVIDIYKPKDEKHYIVVRD